tara:strand:+ start:1205 stop:1693 length:489 start_codon:yes stop_codon:yes gene_type:complete
MSFKIGQGYDVHQLIPKIPLWIGGVNIPHTQGAAGHSDGDVLIHAIIDSILGACNLGDLGHHFPATSDWKNASGLYMLDYTYKIVVKSFPQFRIMNIDSTIILQQPKVGKYINNMKYNISNSLNMDVKNLSIKATTTDKLGPIGLEEGIAAQAMCLIQLNHE